MSLPADHEDFLLRQPDKWALLAYNERFLFSRILPRGKVTVVTVRDRQVL